MIYFLALIPATALTIAGYFVLFLSTRADGSLRSFGRYLGFWAFTLAALVILGAIFAAAHHGHRAHALRHARDARTNVLSVVRRRAPGRVARSASPRDARARAPARPVNAPADASGTPAAAGNPPSRRSIEHE